MTTNADAGTPGSTSCYSLLPTLRTANLDGRFYVFDAALRISPVVAVPTQEVSQATHDIIKRLDQANPERRPLPLDTILSIITGAPDRTRIAQLVERGYLQRIPQDGPVGQGAIESPHTSYGSSEDARRAFDTTGRRHFFRLPRLFNVPPVPRDARVDVACLGVPATTRLESAGAALAPTHLRALSQAAASWFDIYHDGFPFDGDAAGRLPTLLGKSVTLDDYGDVQLKACRVDELFGDLATIVDRAVAQRTAMLFIGGDHGVTFPIVDAYLRRYPDLCLIHLDAHDDAFFSDRVVLDHSATVSNLLSYSHLTTAYSFGVRTMAGGRVADQRSANLRRAAREPSISQRLHIYSIGALSRLLAHPDDFRMVLEQIGPSRPCYLSIDTDVLSSSAIGGQATTPAGAGLEWWQLHDAVSIILAQLNVVACDFVEFNVAARDRNDAECADGLVLLMLLLIHGMGCRVRSVVSGWCGDASRVGEMRETENADARAQASGASHPER